MVEIIALLLRVASLNPGRRPGSQGTGQRGIQVSAPETRTRTNQRASFFGENPGMPITDLFADRRASQIQTRL